MAQIFSKDIKFSKDELAYYIEHEEEEDTLAKQADGIRREVYGKDVYVRGLIEFTNYCKNNCYYCGIRRDNTKTERYRLTLEGILSCCKEGYGLGYRTFVLQGGEDAHYSDKDICELVYRIKEEYPDCAVTLSIGEKKKESYQAYFDAGADRYLLREETSQPAHYGKLHPEEMKLSNRKRCLYDLKEIGYQVGAGFMVDSPFQTTECLVEDLCFLQELSPDMIGIGPYIPHKETPFAGHKQGSLHKTLRLISLIRILFPYALIPATTALGSIHPQGRELGLKAGANVLMPNLSPVDVRSKYDLYENKICVDEEASRCKECLAARVKKAGFTIVTGRGDVKR